MKKIISFARKEQHESFVLERLFLFAVFVIGLLSWSVTSAVNLHYSIEEILTCNF